MSRTVIVSFAWILLLIAGCGAGEPITDDLRSTPGWGELTTTSEEARRLVREGMAEADLWGLMNNSDPSSSANVLFKRAVTHDPEFAFAYLQVANTAPSYLEYRANLDRAIELAEGAGPTERLLIRIAQRVDESDIEGALAAVEELVRLEEASPRAWMERAMVLSRLGREAEARESARRAVALDSAFVQPRLWLANSYIQLDPVDPAMAREHVEVALRLVPDASNVHDLLGDAYRAVGALEEAAAAYTRAAELDPTNALALQQKGHVYSFLGDFEQARASYDAAIELARPDVKVSFGYFRSLVHLHEGNPRGTLEEMERLNQSLGDLGLTDPVSERMYIASVQAFVAAHSKTFDVADRALDRYVRHARAWAGEIGTDDIRRWSQAQIAFTRGFVAVHAGDTDTARREARIAMESRRADRDPTRDWQPHLLLGMADLVDGDPEAALVHFEQTDPNDLYAVYHHALALERSGRTAEARALYERVATTYFNNPPVAMLRRAAIDKVAAL